MAQLTDQEKLNLALKMVFGIQGTSNTDDSAGLNWYEEQNSWRPFLLNDDLYVDVVPSADTSGEADTVATNNPTIVEKVDIQLSLIVGTNERAWAAYQTPGDPSSGLYSDWLIPQIFGTGYAMKLFQDNGSGTGPGTEITTTQGAWIPSYKLGFIILGAGHTAANEGWTSPLWVRVYRYVGATGISGSTAGVSLDDAYNEGSTITVDGGAVTLSATGGYAPLELTPIGSAPTTGLADGQIVNVSGLVYSYDATRSKWLTIDQPVIDFSTRSGDANYLASGWFSATEAGFTALRDGTIIGIGANGTSNLTKGFSIRKGGSSTDISTFALSGGVYTDSTTDIDFTAGDILQVYCSATGAPVINPRVDLHIAWRL